MATIVDATLIIPTYNRRDALTLTLQQLLKLDYPVGSWEVVVVDDGSTDGTEAAIEELATGGTIRFLRQANAGPAAARNRGAAEARGRILVFIDNDILVEPNFLRLHLQTLTANPSCWVVGRVVHPEELRKTPFGRYRDACWEQFHNSHSGNEPAETGGLTAANLSLPAEDFRRLGGFDTTFTIASCEDAELGIRARRDGVRVLYHPGIVVVHNDWAVSLDRFCERQRLYSRSDVILWQKYGENSPRAQLVCENGPISRRRDSFRLIVRKGLKRLLASRLGRFAIKWSARLAERLAPDSRLCRRLYDLAVGVAIFRGVREQFATDSIATLSSCPTA